MILRLCLLFPLWLMCFRASAQKAPAPTLVSGPYELIKGLWSVASVDSGDLTKDGLKDVAVLLQRQASRPDISHIVESYALRIYARQAEGGFRLIGENDSAGMSPIPSIAIQKGLLIVTYFSAGAGPHALAYYTTLKYCYNRSSFYLIGFSEEVEAIGTTGRPILETDINFLTGQYLGQDRKIHQKKPPPLPRVVNLPLAPLAVEDLDIVEGAPN